MNAYFQSAKTVQPPGPNRLHLTHLIDATRLTLTAFLAKLTRSEHAHHRWFGGVTVCAAWLGLVLAALTPPHGTGFTVCWLKAATGMSCPGCGLTRSLSCGLRGMWVASWHYHPLGLPILGLFLIAAGSSVLPTSARKRLTGYLQSHALFFNSLYLLFVATFLAFGLTRMLIEVPHVCHFW